MSPLDPEAHRGPRDLSRENIPCLRSIGLLFEVLQTVCGLNTRNSSHSSESQEPESKVLAGLVPAEGVRENLFQAALLASGGLLPTLIPAFVFMWCSLGVCGVPLVCVVFPCVRVALFV